MKEVKVKEASSAECSSKDYATEDYNWIDAVILNKSPLLKDYHALSIFFSQNHLV